MAVAGTLEIQLLANVARLQSDMGRATKSVGGAMSSIEKSVSVAKNAFLGLAAGMGVRKVLDFADAWGQLASRMALSTGSMKSGNEALSRLVDLSNRVYKPLEATSELFIATSKTLEEMGYSAEATMQMVEALSYSLTVSGADTQKSKSVMDAWSKALLIGKMGMDEFTSVIVGAPRLQEALAESLGVTNAGLMGIVKAGDLTADMMMKVGAQAVKLGKETDQMPVSMGDAFTKMGNSLMLFFGRADSGFGVIEALTGAMGALSDSIITASKWIKENALAIERLNAAVFLAAKLTAGYFVIIVAAPAILLAINGAFLSLIGSIALYLSGMGTATAATLGFNTVLFGTSVAANLAVGALTRLNLLAAVVFAAFIGWEVGKYLSEQFLVVRLAGITMIDLLLTGFQHLETAALRYIAAIKSLVPGLESYADANARITAEHDKAIATIKENTTSMMVWEMRVKSTAAEETKLTEVKERALTLSKEQIAAAKKLAESQASFIKGLEKEVALLGATNTAQKLYEAAELKITGIRLAHVKALLSQVSAHEAATEAAKLLKKANEELTAAEYNRVSALLDKLPAMADANKAMADETALLGLSTYAQFSVTQARRADTIAIKEQKLARMQNSFFKSREQYALEAEIELLKERMGLEQNRASKNIAVEQADEATAAWKKTAEQINQGLTDSLYRAFESGKGFFQSLWDSIKNLFKTTVLRMIIAPVSAGITGMLGMSGTANAGGTSAMSSSLGIVDTVSRVYSTVTGSFAALGDSVAFAANDIGAWLVQNTTGTLNSFGSSLMSGAGGIGTVATAIAAAAAGIAVGSLIAGDKVVLGMDGTTTAAIGTAIGFAVGGPLGAVIGGAIGGFTNRVFGMGAKSTTASGINGNFSASGATDLQSYQNWSQKGGWFRSDKSGTNNSALDAGSNDAINNAVTAAANSVRAYASIIGMSADAVNNFTQAINISLLGLSAEEAEKAIIKSVADFTEAMADAAYGASLRAFQMAGETITATLLRLGTDLMTVNQSFSTMGEKLMFASVSGADAASKLVAVMGGADAFSASTSAYYAAFYSESERVTNSTRQLTEVLNALGLPLPGTTEGFRDLVEAQDLMRDSGRATYAVLLALAPAFDEITTAAENLARAASDAAKSAIADAMAALGRAVDAERDQITKAYETQAASVQNSLDTVSASVSKLQSLSSVLRSTLNSMSIAGSQGANRSNAQATIAAALAQARAGGGLPMQGELDESLRVVAQPSEQLYASFEEYSKDFYRTANDISALSKLTDSALSADQVMQRLMTDQLALLKSTQDESMSRLDGILVSAQAQVNAINGVNISVLTVAAATAQLGVAITGLASAQAAAKAQAAAQAAAVAAAVSLPASISYDDFNKKFAAFTGMPTFAVGTNRVPQDMTAKIHKGERIIPAADNSELMARLRNPGSNGDALIEEIRALRKEVEGLRVEAKATAAHTNKTARLLDRVTPSGTAIATVPESS